MFLLYLLLKLQKVNVLTGSKKYSFRLYKVSPEALLFTPCQYILLIATVIKDITPTTFNHVIYNISDFLHFPAEMKCTRAAPSYIVFLAGKYFKKSKMLYIIFSKRNLKHVKVCEKILGKMGNHKTHEKT